jgi:hypothetical protein
MLGWSSISRLPKVGRHVIQLKIGTAFHVLRPSARPLARYMYSNEPRPLNRELNNIFQSLQSNQRLLTTYTMIWKN